MAEQTSDSAGILELVNRTVELPTLPEVLTRLAQVIHDEDSSADDVAAVIERDPAVATNVLRIVNSAYYGLQVRVSAVSLAVSIMGFQMTKKVALKAAVFSTFAGKGDSAGSGRFDPKTFWSHSIFTGVAARTLGTASPVFEDHDGEDLYVCGLLHDIGKIILADKATEDYDALLASAAGSGRAETSLEMERFGFTHADVGSVLAIKWFLPEDLTIAIRYHHAPATDPFHQSLSSLIHLADHLAWSAGRPSTQGSARPELDHEVYDRVGLTPDDVADLLPQIEQDFEAVGLPF